MSEKEAVQATKGDQMGGEYSDVTVKARIARETTNGLRVWLIDLQTQEAVWEKEMNARAKMQKQDLNPRLRDLPDFAVTEAYGDAKRDRDAVENVIKTEREPNQWRSEAARILDLERDASVRKSELASLQTKVTELTDENQTLGDRLSKVEGMLQSLMSGQGVSCQGCVSELE